MQQNNGEAREGAGSIGAGDHEFDADRGLGLEFRTGLLSARGLLFYFSSLLPAVLAVIEAVAAAKIAVERTHGLLELGSWLLGFVCLQV
jgi:hypothetical protein